MQPGLIAFPFFTVKYLRTTLDSNYSLYEAIKDRGRIRTTGAVPPVLEGYGRIIKIWSGKRYV